MSHSRLIPLALTSFFLVSLLGCTVPTAHAPKDREVHHQPATGKTTLVFKVPHAVSRAVLSEAGYLTVGVKDSEGQERFAWADRKGNTFAVTIDGLIEGLWTMKLRLYDSYDSASLLFYANLEREVTSGRTTTIDNLEVYEPGTFAVGGVELAGSVDHLSVVDLKGGSHTHGDPAEGDDLVLKVGKTFRLVAEPQTVDGDPATDQGVTWASSDDSVVQVSAIGKLTPVALGSALVTVTSNEGRLSISFPVTVEVPIFGLWKTESGNSEIGMVRITRDASGILQAEVTTNNGDTAYQPLVGKIRGPLLDDFSGYWQLVPNQDFDYEEDTSWQPYQYGDPYLAFHLLPDGRLVLENESDRVDTFTFVEGYRPVTNLWGSQPPAVGGETHPLDFNVEPGNATLSELYWIADDPGLAGIDHGADTVTYSSTQFGRFTIVGRSLDNPELTIASVHTLQYNLETMSGGFTHVAADTSGSGMWFVSGYDVGGGVRGFLGKVINDGTATDEAFNEGIGGLRFEIDYASGLYQFPNNGDLFLQGPAGYDNSIGSFRPDGFQTAWAVESNLMPQNDDSNFTYYHNHPVMDSLGNLYSLGARPYSGWLMSITRVDTTTYDGSHTAGVPFWSASTNFNATDMAVMSDDRIAVVGFEGQQTTPRGILTIVNTSGGEDVRIVFPMATISGLSAVKIDAQGRIVATGFVSTGAMMAGYGHGLIDHGIVARFAPDGSFDTSFGEGGILALPTAFLNPMDLDFQSDGRIVVVGSTDRQGKGNAFVRVIDRDGWFVEPIHGYSQYGDDFGASAQSVAVANGKIAIAGIYNKSDYFMNYDQGASGVSQFKTKPLFVVRDEYSLYALKFDANGGDSGSTTSFVSDGDSEPLNHNATHAGGHTLLGWNTKPDGSGTMYHNGDWFTINGHSLLLYAMWSGSITVNFSVPAPQALSFDTASQLLSLAVQPDLTLETTNNSLKTEGTQWKWYLDNVLDTSQTGSQYVWDWAGKDIGQYRISVSVRYRGISYSGSMLVTVRN